MKILSAKHQILNRFAHYSLKLPTFQGCGDVALWRVPLRALEKWGKIPDPNASNVSDLENWEIEYRLWSRVFDLRPFLERRSCGS